MDTFIELYCNHPTQKLYKKIKGWLYRHKKYQTAVVIGIFTFITLLVTLYFYIFEHNKIYLGDFIFHSTRIHELHQDLLHLQWPLVTLHSSMPLGIAVNVFYPWLSLVPFLILTIATKNPITTYLVLLGMFMLGRYVIAYYSYRTYDKSKWHSFIFAILYGTSVTSVYWYCQSEDVGASLGIMFLPLVFYGFIALLKKNHWLMMTVGLLLIAYSHLLTMLMMVVFLAVLVVLDCRRLNEQQWLSLGKSLCVTGILSILQWLPMIMISANNSIFFPPTSTGSASFAKGLLFYNNDFLGIFLPLVAMITAASPRKHTRFDKQMYMTLTICILVNLKLIGYILYTFMPFIRVLQYVNRLGCIGNLATTFVLMKYLCQHGKEPARVDFNKFFVLLPIILLAFSNILVQPFSTIEHTKTFTQRNRQFLLEHPSRWIAYDRNTHSVTNQELITNIHQPMYSDYLPEVTVQHWHEAYRQEPYSYEYHRLLPTKIYSTNDGIKLHLKHSERNLTLPITYYHGMKYRWNLNHKILPKGYINWKLSNRSQQITVKKLPKGFDTVSIKSAHLKY